MFGVNTTRGKNKSLERQPHQKSNGHTMRSQAPSLKSSSAMRLVDFCQFGTLDQPRPPTKNVPRCRKPSKATWITNPRSETKLDVSAGHGSSTSTCTSFKQSANFERCAAARERRRRVSVTTVTPPHRYVFVSCGMCASMSIFLDLQAYICIGAGKHERSITHRSSRKTHLRELATTSSLGFTLAKGYAYEFSDGH
jgi:hypothetical protein